MSWDTFVYVAFVVSVISFTEVVLVNRKPVPSRDIRLVALVMMYLGFIVNAFVAYFVFNRLPFNIVAAVAMCLVIITWAVIVLMLVPYAIRRKTR